MASWTFLTNHARVLLCVAHDPGARLRDIAASLDITERSAFGIMTDLAEAGYVVKEKDGRRNRYLIETHLPLRESISAERPATSNRFVTAWNQRRLTDSVIDVVRPASSTHTCGSICSIK